MFSKLFGGTKTKNQTTESKQEVTLPHWIEMPARNVLDRAMSLSQQGYEGYDGQRLAEFSPEELRAFGLTEEMIGRTTPYIEEAAGISREVARRGLEGFNQDELSPFMNPYIQNVLDVSRDRQLTEFDRRKRDVTSNRAGLNAFGGSRVAFDDAQMYDDFARRLNETETTGLASAYDNAMANAMGGSRMAGQSAMDFANLGLSGQRASLTDIGALSEAGLTRRSLEQAGLDVNYADFLEEREHPYKQLSFAQSITDPLVSQLRGSASTNTQPYQQEYGGLLNKAVGLGSMAGSIPGVSSFMQSGLGALAGRLFGGQSTSTPTPSVRYQGSNVFYDYKNGGVVGTKNYESGGLVSMPNGIKQFLDDLFTAKNDTYKSGLSREVIMDELARERKREEFYAEEERKQRGTEEEAGLPSNLGASLEGLYDPSSSFWSNLEGYATPDKSTRLSANDADLSILENLSKEELKSLMDIIYSIEGNDQPLPKRKPTRDIESYEEGGRVRTPMAADVLRERLGAPLLSLGNRLAEYAIENPMEAAGLGLLAVPGAGVAKAGLKTLAGTAKFGGKAAKGVTKSPMGRSIAAGAAGLGLMQLANPKTPREQWDADAKLLADYRAELEKNKGSTPSTTNQTKTTSGKPVQQDIIKAFSDKGVQFGPPNIQGGGIKPIAPLGGSSEETTQKEEEKQGLNIPLLKFGATLLSSDRPFFKALADATAVGIDAKEREELKVQKKEEAIRQTALDALKQRMEQEQLNISRYNAETNRLNTAPKPVDPLDLMKKQLEIKKLQKDIVSGGKDGSDTQKRIDTFAKEIFSQGRVPDMRSALIEAEKLVSGGSGGSSGGAVSYKDYIRQ